MWKTITRERNKRFIIAYYALALVFVSIGFFKQDAQWYIIAIAFLLLATFRKYWLMKKLKE